MVALWFRHFFAALAAVYPVLLEHCRSQPPDLVCYDATHWPARLVAQLLGIPAVRTVPNLAENDTYGQVGEQLTAGLGPDHPDMAAFAEDVAAFAAEHDVELDVPSTLDVSEALNLVFEVDLLRMRTREGMAVARAKGRLKGRAPKLSTHQQGELARMHATGDLHHRRPRGTVHRLPPDDLPRPRARPRHSRSVSARQRPAVDGGQ